MLKILLLKFWLLLCIFVSFLLKFRSLCNALVARAVFQLEQVSITFLSLLLFSGSSLF